MNPTMRVDAVYCCDTCRNRESHRRRRPAMAQREKELKIARADRKGMEQWWRA